MTERFRNAGIIGLGSAVPDKVLTNFDLEKIVETSNEWIVERTGILERRIADADTAASDLGAKAAMKALESANLTPEEVDLIIVATVTGDYPFPSTACIIQHKIGARNAAAFDLSAGCSGFVYGMSVASGMVRSGSYNKVLIIGTDLVSRATNWSDRTTCVLFGDGAGAAVVGPVEEGSGFLSFVLGSDGGGGDYLMIEGGGSRLPVTEEVIKSNRHCVTMRGREVFKFAVRIMGDAAVEVLEKCGLTTDDVDMFIPHQANIRIIDSAAKRMSLSPEKVFINVQKYGNTSAASIPLAMDEAWRQGKLKKDNTIVVVGFGAGLTWAAGVMKWGLEASGGTSS